MQKFEQELSDWADVIGRYATVSRNYASKVRRILKKNKSSEEMEDFIQVFGKSLQFQCQLFGTDTIHHDFENLNLHFRRQFLPWKRIQAYEEFILRWQFPR